MPMSMPMPKGIYLLYRNLRGFVVAYKDYDTDATVYADIEM